MRTGKSRGSSSSRTEKEELLEVKGVAAIQSSSTHVLKHRGGAGWRKVRELRSVSEYSTLDSRGQRSTKSWAEAVDYTGKGKREVAVCLPRLLNGKMSTFACSLHSCTFALTSCVSLPASLLVLGFVFCFFKVVLRIETQGLHCELYLQSFFFFFTF